MSQGRRVFPSTIFKRCVRVCCAFRPAASFRLPTSGFQDGRAASCCFFIYFDMCVCLPECQCLDVRFQPCACKENDVLEMEIVVGKVVASSLWPSASWGDPRIGKSRRRDSGGPIRMFLTTFCQLSGSHSDMSCTALGKQMFIARLFQCVPYHLQV